MADNGLRALFEKNLEHVFDGQGALGAYRYFDQACRQSQCALSIQLFWRHLAQSRDESVRKLLVESICSYFNVNGANVSPAQSFETTLNDALLRALESSSIPLAQLREFFKSAQKTRLLAVIDTKIQADFVKRSVYDENTPTQERCRFLSDLICDHHRAHGETAGMLPEIERLADTQFKEYARTVLETVQPGGLYEYFNNRRKLNKLHQLNHDFDDKPGCVKNMCVEHYNAFDPLKFQGRRYDRHTPIDLSLGDPALMQDLLVGYRATSLGNGTRASSYQLYACDANDGYAIWAAPFRHGKKRPFAQFGDKIYCVKDSGAIAVISKKDGSSVNESPVMVDEEIEYMAITSKGVLFAVCKTKFIICDLTQWQDGKIYPLPKNVEYYSASLIGEKLILKGQICCTDGISFVLLDKDGEMQIVKGERPAYVLGNLNSIFYTQELDELNHSLICLDYETGRKKWEYTLPAMVASAPCLSRDGTMLFCLTYGNLIALDVRTICSGNRILWKTAIEKLEIDDILVSPDENALYGLAANTNAKLLRFDCTTGTKEFLYELGFRHEFVAAGNGKLYIKWTS